MNSSNLSQLLIKRIDDETKVVRIVEPDLRRIFDHVVEVVDCDLYKQLDKEILEPMQMGETVILNLGLVEYVTSRVYTLFLMLRSEIIQRGGRLILCNLNDRIEELLGILGGDRLFEFCKTEMSGILRVTREDCQPIICPN